ACAPAILSRCASMISIGGRPRCQSEARADERRDYRCRKMPGLSSASETPRRGRPGILRVKRAYPSAYQKERGCLHRAERYPEGRDRCTHQGRTSTPTFGCDSHAAGRRHAGYGRCRAASSLAGYDGALRQGQRHDAAADRAALAGRLAMLSRDLARYVDQKRSLGFKFESQNFVLCSFVRFAYARGVRYIRIVRVLQWAGQAPSPEHARTRLLMVRRFALALHAENARHQVPARDALGQANAKRRTPYIYSADEIERLLRAAAALPPAQSSRPIVYVTLLGLIAATGVRIAEALVLQLDDITADGLIIRESKFHKTRLLPLHVTTRN